jgi:hypothetical protein
MATASANEFHLIQAYKSVQVDVRQCLAERKLLFDGCRDRQDSVRRQETRTNEHEMKSSPCANVLEAQCGSVYLRPFGPNVSAKFQTKKT